MTDAVQDRRSSDVNYVKLEARIERLEEKHDDIVKVIEKLATKVDALSSSIQKASWVIVGGGGVVYFLMSGKLPHILALGGAQ